MEGKGFSSSGQSVMELKLRTPTKDVPVTVPAAAKVDELAQTALVALELSTCNTKLRFIFNGKLLQPGSAPLASFGIVSGSFVHTVIKQQQPQEEPIPSATSDQADLEANESNETNPLLSDTLSNRLGSRMIQFHHIRITSEDDTDQVTPEASYKEIMMDVMWGFCIGMLLGALSTFFLFERNINIRHRTGIMIGFCCKIFLEKP